MTLNLLSSLKTHFNKKYFKAERGLFTEEYLHHLKQEVLASKYLAKNVLNYRFGTTLGYSIIFKNHMKDTVIEKFPYFKEYLQAIDQVDTNLFYLNPLVLQLHSLVERHIDFSLNPYAEDIPYPNRVSVLYTSIPDMLGGQLIFYKPTDHFKRMAEFKPEENLLFHFRGDLLHEVTQIEAFYCKDNQYRISIVCEQYTLQPDQLDKIPDYTVKSSISFKDYVENAVTQAR